MSADGVALLPQWVPQRLAAARSAGKANWIDDSPDQKLVFYCPEWAEREFAKKAEGR